MPFLYKDRWLYVYLQILKQKSTTIGWLDMCVMIKMKRKNSICCFNFLCCSPTKIMIDLWQSVFRIIKSYAYWLSDWDKKTFTKHWIEWSSRNISQFTVIWNIYNQVFEVFGIFYSKWGWNGVEIWNSLKSQKRVFVSVSLSFDLCFQLSLVN